MAQFSVNPNRFDPYKNFKFRVKWPGMCGLVASVLAVVERGKGYEALAE